MTEPPYRIKITRQAKKSIDDLPQKLKKELRAILIEVLAINPYEGKKLLGDLAGSYG